MNEETKIAVEEVSAVDAPPKARVEDIESPGEKLERKRDYLDGFLNAKPIEVTVGEPGSSVYDGIIEALKDIFDPEIPVNIYDLGLIYGVEVTDDGHAVVSMTLTTPHCPVAETMPAEVELRVGAVPGVGDVEVKLELGML